MNQQIQKQVQQEEEERRYAKAVHIAEVGHIHQFQGETNRWLVQSQTDKERWYMITLDEQTDLMWCSCPDSNIRGNVCKHCLSVCIRYTKVI